MSFLGRDYLTLGKRLLFTEKLFERNQGHIYVIGGSGTGKSSELYNLLIQRLRQPGSAAGCVDIHGDLNKELKKAALNLLSKEERRKRLVILDPTRGSFGYNPLEVKPGEEPYPKVLDMLSVIKKLWRDSWGERMADILRNSCMVMAEKNLTMCQIPRFLTDEAVRRELVKDLENKGVKEYWQDRFGSLTPNTQAEWVESTLNKINKFLADPLIRRVVCQRHSTINFRNLLDSPSGKILLITLPKGIIKENVYLLGGLIINGIQEAALSRTDIPEEDRSSFRLVIDEFQNFGAGNQNFQEVLSEARKYSLYLTLSHQNLDQIDEDLLASILGNTTCQIIFRTSRKDSEVLAKEIFDVNIDDLEWEREQGETRLNLPERWEDHLNKLTNLDHRQAYVAKKEGTQTSLIRTLDMETFEATPKELETQADWIMKPYCKSPEEIQKEQEELNKKLEPKQPSYKG
ncbi:MAG: type IV secretory system conjugative DNA transfer family protein [Candidatus Bipolaricaulota bacterium]